jgi:hypothetical protein
MVKEAFVPQQRILKTQSCKRYFFVVPGTARQGLPSCSNW